MLAGLLSGVWSVLVTERATAPALAIEASRAATSPGDPGEVVSRTTQLWGGLLGIVVAAVVFAVLLGTVYAGLRHRLPGATDFGRVAVLTAIGFGVFALLPAVALPANPPAVGDPETIGFRTTVYGAVLASGVLTALLVAAAVSVLRSRGVGVPGVTAAGVVLAVVVLAALMEFTPDSPDVIPSDVPTTVVWEFRLASLGQLAVLWSSLGLVGGWLVDRLARSTTGP